MHLKARHTIPYSTPVAVIVLSSSGMKTAQRIASILPGARLHGLLTGGLRRTDLDTVFTDTTHHLRQLFVGGHAIIGVCASSILIRILGPILANKQDEPPVLAVAINGYSVVPLIGSHHGANVLACTVAHLFDVSPAITTASDILWGLTLDEPPIGWHVANPVAVKMVLSALFNNKPVALQIEAGTADWITMTKASFVSKPSALTVRVTDRATLINNQTLVLHPPTLAIGVGCVRGVPPEELMHHVFLTLANYGLSSHSVAVIASLDLKADEPAVLGLAEALAVPVRFLSAVELEAMTPRLPHPSTSVFRIVGCHSVAEAAALIAAGPDSVLIVNKQRSKQVTCAIARASVTIDPARVGRPRGRLSVVGIGPGATKWRVPAASDAITESVHVVGYSLYLDLLGHTIDGKVRHETPLGAEVERVRTALDLAGKGETVALVCSGDAGIYALAALVFDLMSSEKCDDWNRIDVQVVPGISALQAAAAQVGAPLGSDFCAISLSDLLTPWPIIENRLHAAAIADFVVALYNPVSRRRHRQLTQARDILLAHRPSGTPVILARNLGRHGECTTIIRLDALTPEQVDMLTLVLVGSSESKCVTIGRRQWVYTPHGYRRGSLKA